MSMNLGKLYQISGFILLVAMLFAGFSIYSYSPDDPAWNQYVSYGQDRVRNLGGAIGAALADIGLQSLGSSIVLLLGAGAVAGWSLMQQHLRRTVEVICRGLILVGAVSTGSYILFGRDPFFGSGILAGGVTGQWLATVGVNYLNTFGALLVVLSAVVLALFVGVNMPNWRVGQLPAWREMIRLPEWLNHCREMPRRAYAWGLGVIGGITSICRQCWQRVAVRLDGDVEDEQGEFSAMSNPRVDDDDDDDDDADWEMVDEDDESPIVAHPVATSVAPRSARPTIEQAIDITPAVKLPTRKKAKRRRGSALDRLPSLDLLDEPEPHTQSQPLEELEEQARFLEERLRDFGITGEVVHVQQGPVITMFEYAPASGVKVSRIVNLQDDLALVLKALSVRVVAPIPGKAAVGIEVPNKHHEIVRLREVLDLDVIPHDASKLTLALGRDITGAPMATDLAKTPHLLIAGATGAGKSVGLNCMICSMLFRATPEEVRLIMIDPKMLELSIYEGVPHLLVPVVTNPKQAALALRRVVEEMERRYQLLAAKGVRNISQYNDALDHDAANGHASGRQVERDMAEMPDEPVEEKLPFLVVVIDELSDLMMVSSKEVEDSLTRIAQMARAAGIHLIVATQRPSVDVLTGVIKANFPARLSFQVTSKTDSRTILDANGAEKLLGRGDMLFLAPGTSKPQRVHSAFVSETEINRLVKAWKDVDQPQYDERFLVSTDEPSEAGGEEEYDEKYDEAVALVAATGQASISMVQRRLRVGYNRAARMIEIMEKEGIVGPSDGVKPREVLVRKSFDYDGA